MAVVLNLSGTSSKRLEIQLIENALREDLSPLDQARAFKKLADRNGWSVRQVAEALHLHASTVSRSLALLKLPESVRNQVESGQISPRQARELGKPGNVEKQSANASRVVAEGLTVAEAIIPGDEPDPTGREVEPGFLYGDGNRDGRVQGVGW